MRPITTQLNGDNVRNSATTNPSGNDFLCVCLQDIWMLQHNKKEVVCCCQVMTVDNGRDKVRGSRCVEFLQGLFSPSHLHSSKTSTQKQVQISQIAVSSNEANVKLIDEFRNDFPLMIRHSHHASTTCVSDYEPEHFNQQSMRLTTWNSTMLFA